MSITLMVMMMPRGRLRWNLKNRLAYMRETRDLSQQQLADLVKVNKSRLGNWEIDISRPSDQVIERLAKVLRCRPHDIFPFE